MHHLQQETSPLPTAPSSSPSLFFYPWRKSKDGFVITNLWTKKFRSKKREIKTTHPHMMPQKTNLTGWRVIIGGTAGQVMCLNDLPPMEPRLECFCAYNSSLFHQRQATRLSQTRHLSHTQSSGHSPPNQQTPSRRHLFLSLDLDFSLRASGSLSLSLPPSLSLFCFVNGSLNFGDYFAP
jgi:hypothetical protein